MSTTSSCRACCSAISCARPTRMPGSNRSTPTPRWRAGVSRGSDRRGSRAAGPALDADAGRATSRWCWPTARCCSRARRSPSSSPTDRYAAADGLTGRGRVRRAAGHRRSVQGAEIRRGAARGSVGDPNAEGAHGPRKHPNHIFTWEAGDKAATEQVIGDGRCRGRRDGLLPPHVHPCPLETCGCVASMDKVNGKLTAVGHLPGAACDPHRGSPDFGHRGAQHPRDLARYRRRLRQQGRAPIRAMSAPSSPPSSPASR